MAYRLLGPGLPEVEVTLALEDVDDATPTWLDITQYARAGSISRGRENAHQRTAPGVCRLTLDNTDGRFDPSYTAGPYYPDLVPRRRIRVRFRYLGVEYPAFVGYTEGWPQAWPSSGHDSLVTLVATDGFLLLAGAEFDADQDAFPEESAFDRVERVLTLFGADLGAPGGNSDEKGLPVVAWDEPRGSMLDHLHTVVESEGGFLYVHTQGGFNYQSRRFRVDAETLIPRGYFTDAISIGEGSRFGTYHDLVPSADDEFLYNDIQITDGNGTVWQASDAASVGRYGKRTFAQTTVLTAAAAESKAAFLLARHKDPRLRVELANLKGAREPAVMWPQLLLLEPSAFYTFHRTPLHGEPWSMDLYVESLSVEFRPGWFDTDWTLGPYGTQGYEETSQLDDPSNATLDSTAVLVH